MKESAEIVSAGAGDGWVTKQSKVSKKATYESDWDDFKDY